MTAVLARWWLAAACVAVTAAALTLPYATATPHLWNDAVEYLAIGNAWVHGSGFVDPVRWTSYLPVGPPFPAVLLRAPLPAVVLALPLWLGLGVGAAKAFHAMLASLVAGGLVLFGRRLMGLAAAVACALAIAVMPGWRALAGMPMSDLPAIGALLIVLALGARVADSPRWAAASALATLLAWATRPTLVALAPAIVLVQLWQRGVQGACRSRALATYVVLTVAGFVAARVAVVVATGHAPYEGYGFMMEMLSLHDPLSYGTQYVGTLRFVATHPAQIVLALGRNVVKLGESLFVMPQFARLGWLVVPGTAYCLLAGAAEPGRIDRRLVAMGGILSAALALTSYGAFDANRYPLPLVVCGTLCGFAALDDLLGAAAQRLPAAAERSGLLRAVPLLVTLLVAGDVRPALLAAARWRPGPALAEPPGIEVMRDVCRSIAPGGLVAATDPWTVHAWCGNPALQLPVDLERAPELQRRFFDEQRPDYVVSSGRGLGVRWLQRSPLLRPIARSGRIEVHAVVSPPATTADDWLPPPPLMCAGYGAGCAQSLGR